MGCCLSIGNQHPLAQLESETASALTDGAQIPGVPDLSPECAGEEQGKEASGPGDQLQDVPSPPGDAAHTSEIEETVITSIRATNVVLGLRRVPAGFYAVVHHSGLEWRTEKKRSSVSHDVVQWNGPIPIPSDPLATICLEVYASFELQPTLGAGEQLRELAITVKELLDCSAKDVPFTLPPIDGDVVSPCSSILVTAKHWRSESHDSSASKILNPHCSTTESLDKLEDATNQGHRALSRYRKHGEKQDLEHSIEQFESALSVCPSDHPCLAAAQSNLAMAKFILCQLEGANASLDVPLGLYRDALAARPVDHLDRPSTLLQLAAVHFARFGKERDEVESVRTETLLHEALELSTTDSHENPAASFMLQLHAGHRADPVRVDGQSPGEQDSPTWSTDGDPWILGVEFLERFKRLDDLTDLQQAITVLEELVGSASIEDVRYTTALGKLGLALQYRFNRVGELSDLENAISRQRGAVGRIPHGHPDKPSLLDNLGNSLLTRFECVGELNDLEDAISTQRDAVELTPRGHPDKPGHLSNLGNSFFTRFQHIGELSDLEDAILTQRDAVELTPHGDPDGPTRLNNLSDSFLARFERVGELSDLEEAISRQRNTIELIPHGHPDMPSLLSNLGNSLLSRFERVGELSDLENAISTQRDAVELTPHGHANKPGYLSNLGGSFFARFQHIGELSDLEDAISTQRDAVELTLHGDPYGPTRLNNLGNSFLARFERLGELSDLEEALSRQRDAVELTPHGHSHMPSLLSNLGNSFLARFERLGELSDLEDAISSRRDAVELTPHGHANKPALLNNLGSSFRARFERVGELSDLEDAISTQRDAVELTPHGHLDKPGRLNNLGNSFLARFERLGELSDLEEAISRQRDAVELTPHGHPDKPDRLSNLGISFRTRFQRLGELSDLEDAILRQRDSVELIPHGHPHEPGLLHNLGDSFLTRFERLGELSDLEDAISRQRDSIVLTPHGHPDKPGCLNDLGISFLARFQRLGELSDLEEAISRQMDAVELAPHGHPDKPGRLNNLGISFLARFQRLGELSDLEDAISTQRDAVELTPHGHPHKPLHLSNLGNSFRARFDRLGVLGDMEQAISVYSYAASAPTGPISDRFYASHEWISCARHIHHHSLFDACSIAITLLPQLAWIGLSLTDRYRELMGSADVVREAAAAALGLGFPETAVEWLEQGRSIVWGELSQLRNSYEELSSAHPDHARRLRELSAALEHASIAREKSWSALLEPAQSSAHHVIRSLKGEGDSNRALAIERDKLLHQIRSFPGFERFLLLHKEFSQLRASAHSGPVVILNAAQSRCDALIVLADVDHAIHVPLPNFTFERSTFLQNMLQKSLGHSHGIHPDERKGKLVASPQGGDSWEVLLSNLWKCVVGPVLDALAFKTPAGDPSRIFWCPTGPFMFLPIHGAGFYDTQHAQPRHKVSDFVVSSYVPTLSILALSPHSSTPSSSDLRLLTVRQPPSDGLTHLPGVAAELTHIREVIRDSPSAHITLVESSDGTVEEVLGLMKEADWVHFACHGVQDAANPTSSGLCLADRRRLKLGDIIAVSRPHGGLAFLSACQTAMGDERLSDEAIHITAGMLFAGYGAVIGTMWSISDKLAPELARDVYRQLFQNGTRPDYREAARALHEAIWRLRHSNASFVEWLPFIHVGL